MKFTQTVSAIIVLCTALAQAQLAPPDSLQTSSNLPPVVANDLPQQRANDTTITTTSSNKVAAVDASVPAVAIPSSDTNTVDSDSDFIALPVTSVDTPEAESTNAASSKLISIALDDVSMEDVVRMFSRNADANIIATPSNLTAHVTANLNNVEWYPALSSILSMHNMALVEKPAGSHVYKIVPRAADAPEPLVVETIFLEYTTVDEVTPVVKSMLPERGSVSVFTSRNALVVRSTADNISEIKSVIKDIDIESKQICIEALFMELSDSAMKQLGIRWDSLEEFKVGVKAGPFAYKSDSEHTQSRVDELARHNNRSSVDTLSKQYDEFGAPISGNPSRDIKDTIDIARNATSDIKDDFSKTITQSKAAILNVDTLNVVLSALKKTDGVSVVSNPKMIVANGATNAFFRVGEREPITKTTKEQGTTDSPGDTFITELDTGIDSEFIKNGYLHTGIELQVIPTVKTDNLIEALISPSLRRKIGEKTVKISDDAYNSWPIISVKEIKTRFTLESGQTVAIGGLTDTTKEKTVTKIPLLGDIPLLGKYLFSHTKDSKKQVETIIFVTLSIANPQKLKEEEAIPSHARLAQKRIIQDKLDKYHLDRELKKMQNAADAEMNISNKTTIDSMGTNSINSVENSQ